MFMMESDMLSTIIKTPKIFHEDLEIILDSNTISIIKSKTKEESIYMYLYGKTSSSYMIHTYNSTQITEYSFHSDKSMNQINHVLNRTKIELSMSFGSNNIIQKIVISHLNLTLSINFNSNGSISESIYIRPKNNFDNGSESCYNILDFK